MNSLFDYPDPLQPGDQPLSAFTDIDLSELVETWRKDLTSDQG